METLHPTMPIVAEFNHQKFETAAVKDPLLEMSTSELDALRGKVLAVHDETLAVLASADTIEELEQAMAANSNVGRDMWTPAPGPNPKGGDYTVEEFNHIGN